MALRWLALCCLIGFVAGCRGEDVGVAQGGFSVRPTALDFGRDVAGNRTSRTFELVSTGRADVPVTLEVPAPFEVEPTSALIPGGSSLEVQVSYAATEGRASETLLVRGGGTEASVALTGEGVRAIECVPSAQCRVTVFDIETGTCLERVADDNTSCTPADMCLTNGVCSAGVCLGSPRNCDDGNVCTQDACSSETGCVNTVKTCPSSANLCEVPVCDPEDGCGFAEAPDFTLCGPADCVTANLCQAGVCTPLPTPDGFICAPATPCQAEGTCQMGQCERPPEEPLLPMFSIDLPNAPRLGADGRTRVLDGPGGIFFELCGFPPPPVDGGTDAGDDAGGGPTHCALISYTLNGFERFTQVYADAEARALMGASKDVVFVQAPAVLESYGLTGTPMWSVDAGVPLGAPGRAAVTRKGELLVALRTDGGDDAQRLVRVHPDAGLEELGTVTGLGLGGQVALSADETELFVATPQGRFGRVLFAADGGVLGADLLGEDAGTGVLAQSGRSLVVGEGQLWMRAADGGVPSYAGALAFDAGERPEALGALLQQRLGYDFFRACPDPLTSCEPFDEALVVRAFPLALDNAWADAGTSTYRLEVVPPAQGASLEGAALIEGGGVCTLTQTTDGGLRSQLSGFNRGAPLFACDMPEGSRLRGSAFTQGMAFVIAERPDGGYALDAYDLKDLPLEPGGWPVPGSLAGTRRAGPVP